MRILHLVNDVGAHGNGISNVAVDLATEQSRLGHEVHVGSVGGGYEPLLERFDVRCLRLDFTERSPVALVRSFVAVKAAVNVLQPEIIHVHTLTPTVLSVLIPGGPPVVATVHNEYQRGAGLMGLADAVVGVSQAVTQAMQHRHVPRRKTHTVLNGAVGSPRRLANNLLSPVTLRSPSIVALGSICHRKGSDVLLEAFGLVLQDLPEANLYFVGNRDWPALEATLQRQPWASQVHLVGSIDQPQTYLRAADVFVLPSRRDPFSLALLEALEAGCPIVASHVDGVPEALADGKAGLLTPVADPTALATQVLRLLQDADLARRFRDAALVQARKFTVSGMARQYLQLYQILLA